jgi:GT2 family glycosyltransferase/glycosyltransferase involved in cell wall biosynthesis
VYRFWDTIIEPVLEVLQPKSIVEIGSDRGFNTRNLLEFCRENDAKLHVVDPLPKYDVAAWQEQYGEHVGFHLALSLEAIPLIDCIEAVLIDGDHNWYTVYNELKLIQQQCTKLSQPFPLIFLHDVGWPYGRRDLYYNPETIPETYRQPFRQKGMLPESGELLEEGGLNQALFNAVSENGLRNGVLTAIENFLEETEQQLELVKIPGIHGLGVLIPLRLKEQNEELARLLEDLNFSPVAKRHIERVERERLEAAIHQRESRSELKAKATEVKDLREQLADKDKQIADLREDKDQEISDLRDRKDKQISELRKQLSMLGRWVEELSVTSSVLLNSRRWKLGNAIGEAWRRVLMQPRVPMAQDRLHEVLEEFRAWHEGAGAFKFVQARHEPAKSQADAVKTAVPSTPLSSATLKPWRFGSAEHVLASLRNSQPVTVIVPIHNAYEDLEKFLSSAVRNTTAPAELLLIDDASTDSRVPSLLAEYEALENVRVLTNDENLGFSSTINRGFAESSGDVVILNSDTEVTPRWLENLTLAAQADPRTATVTAISDRAGAFSVPETGKENYTPDDLEKDDVGRLVTQRSSQIYPQTPTGNGFCMYIKRAALDEVGPFDAEKFPLGYAEENDFCMRAQKLGWNHTVDDATFVFHKRSASFGDEKKKLLEAARKTLDELHPEYTRLARSFVTSEDMKKVGRNVLVAYRQAESGKYRVKPRLLFVIHNARGGTPYTNLDLMGVVADRYSPYVLVSDLLRLKLFRYEPEGPVLVESWDLRKKWEPVEFSRPDYRAIVFDLLVKYRFELVHVRHLLGHTFDLPEVAALLRIPVVISFHDFYFSCPTLHLIDDNGKYCGGICTPGSGRQCTILTSRLDGLPILKHAWLGTWRLRVERMFEHVDAFVTTSLAAKDVYLRSLPVLHDRPFEVIEHGRDLEQEHLATPPGEGPIKILIPGNINLHKGAGLIRKLKQEDSKNRLEFHFLGEVAKEFWDLGVYHGTYARQEFNDRVREIKPSFMGVFSIWPETYCHTLTEAWGAGVPVLGSDIGTLRERIDAHGGGWLIDHEDPKRTYEQILGIASDPAAYAREVERANLNGIRSTKEMSDDYENLYNNVLRERRQFKPSREVSVPSRRISPRP